MAVSYSGPEGGYSGNLDPMDDEFIWLITEAQSINASVQPGTVQAAWGVDVLGRIRQWIARAIKFAKEQTAETVTITGGLPAGLSISLTFKTRP